MKLKPTKLGEMAKGANVSLKILEDKVKFSYAINSGFFVPNNFGELEITYNEIPCLESVPKDIVVAEVIDFYIPAVDKKVRFVTSIRKDLNVLGYSLRGPYSDK